MEKCVLAWVFFAIALCSLPALADSPIYTGWMWDSAPAAAYNSNNREFLVVWNMYNYLYPTSDERFFGPLMGQLIKESGAIIGEPFSGEFVPSGRGDGIGRAAPHADLIPAQYGNTVGRAIQSCSEKEITCVTALVGLHQNELWEAAMMAAKDARIARLEGRLAALEAKTEYAGTSSLLPGAGIIMGSLGLLWMDRRRRRSCNQNPATQGNLQPVPGQL